MVSDSKADEESITDHPSQLNDRQTILQPGIDTHEPHLSPSSDIVPQSESLVNAGGHFLDTQSSSNPTVDPHSSHSTLDDVELQFVPLVDGDGDLHRVRSSHVEDVLNEKNADMKKSFAENGDSRHHFTENKKVENDHIAGSETMKQNEEMEFDGDDDKEDDGDDDDDDGEEEDEEEEEEDDDDDAIDNMSNANVDNHNVGIGVSTEKQLEEVKDINSKSAHGSSQPVPPTASISELSSSAVNTEATLESGFSGETNVQHFQPVTQHPAVSSGHTESERESGLGSDPNVRQLDSPGVDGLSRSGHIGKDFGQQQADIVGHRGHWYQDNQPGDMRFPDEFDRHLHHGAYPSVAWKHVHSSPVEEFHNQWPKMQEAYTYRPGLMQEQHYHMNQMIDDQKLMHRDQKQFVNHHFDSRWSRVSPEYDHYYQNQRVQSNQLYGQVPNLVVSQWPDEDARERVHYRDMVNNQQQHDHSYRYQEPDIRQPNIRIDQVYRHHPLGQKYMSSFDEKDIDRRPVDKSASSISSSKQVAGQPEFSTVAEEQRSDKSQFDKSDVGQGIQKPSSAEWAETDIPLTEDLTRTMHSNNPQHYRAADMSSSSERYTVDTSQPPPTVLGGKSDHISGE